MKWKPSAFHSDEIELTWWDLVRLMFGKELRDGACKVRRQRRKPKDQR